MGYTDSKGVWRPQDPSEIDPFALAPEQPALGRYVQQLEAALREIAQGGLSGRHYVQIARRAIVPNLAHEGGPEEEGNG